MEERERLCQFHNSIPYYCRKCDVMRKKVASRWKEKRHGNGDADGQIRLVINFCESYAKSPQDDISLTKPPHSDCSNIALPDSCLYHEKSVKLVYIISCAVEEKK